MRKPGPCQWRWRFAALLALLAFSGGTRAQAAPYRSEFTHPYSIGIFTEYSPTSSHILLGYARQRRQVGVGVSLTRRIFAHPSVELDYLVEIRPLLMESDPTIVSFTSHRFGDVNFSANPIPVVVPGNLADKQNIGVAPLAIGGYSNAKFSHRWTYTGGVSPFGFQLNGLKRRRVQPEAMVSGGFLMATRDIPIEQASSFNFVFQFGAGIEWYRTSGQSILLEYRVRHFSNGRLGGYNPGADAGLWKVTYRFGRR